MLTYPQFSDWYSIRKTELLHKGGGPLLRQYPSLEELLKGIYPEHAWDKLKFIEAGFVSPGYWKSVVNQRSFFDLAGKELKIEQVYLLILSLINLGLAIRLVLRNKARSNQSWRRRPIQAAPFLGQRLASSLPRL